MKDAGQIVELHNYYNYIPKTQGCRSRNTDSTATIPGNVPATTDAQTAARAAR